MARYFDVHPANPQRRAIIKIADVVRAAGGQLTLWHLARHRTHHHQRNHRESRESQT
ncbi:MAG: hypothetical protein ACRDOA_08390 [Streptosporangiaceae bacterium]